MRVRRLRSEVRFYFSLIQISGVRPVEVVQHVRRDDDHQFVSLILFRVVHHGLIQERQKSQARESRHRPRIVLRDLARHNSGLAILQIDSTLVFTVRNDRDAVRGLPGERAHLQFNLQAHVAVAVNRGLGLHA